MSQQTTIRKLAALVNTPVEKLLEQLSEAGMPFSDPDQVVTSAEKIKLLGFLRRMHGKDSSAEEVAVPKKITLARRKVQELTVGGGRSKTTVAVEVRQKRTYVKPDAVAASRPGDAIVLAAAGSSDPAAAVDVAAMADLLAARLDAEVSIGFAAGAGPRIGDVVSAARHAGAARVIIASYVLAPGYFAQVIAAAGGDVVTRPLAPDVRIAQIVAERYRTARGELTA